MLLCVYYIQILVVHTFSVSLILHNIHYIRTYMTVYTCTYVYIMKYMIKFVKLTQHFDVFITNLTTSTLFELFGKGTSNYIM